MGCCDVGSHTAAAGLRGGCHEHHDEAAWPKRRPGHRGCRRRALRRGTAAAADYLTARSDTGDGGAVSIGGDAYGYNNDNDSETRVRPSRHGTSAVNSAGDGRADQRVDQSRSTPVGTYRTRTAPARTARHFNSHNSGRYEDSHDDTRVAATTDSFLRRRADRSLTTSTPRGCLAVSAAPAHPW